MNSIYERKKLRFNEVYEKRKKKSVKISHDEEADAGDNEAPELDAVIRRNARGKIIGNLAIEQNNSATDREDNQTEEDPAERKIPIHAQIITHGSKKW